MEKKFKTLQEFLEHSVEGMKNYEPKNTESFYYKKGSLDTLEELLRQIKTGKALFPYI